MREVKYTHLARMRPLLKPLQDLLDTYYEEQGLAPSKGGDDICENLFVSVDEQCYKHQPELHAIQWIAEVINATFGRPYATIADRLEAARLSLHTAYADANTRDPSFADYRANYLERFDRMWHRAIDAIRS
jgi:hypothetical protein